MTTLEIDVAARYANLIVDKYLNNRTQVMHRLRKQFQRCFSALSANTDGKTQHSIIKSILLTIIKEKALSTEQREILNLGYSKPVGLWTERIELKLCLMDLVNYGYQINRADRTFAKYTEMIAKTLGLK